MAAFCEEEIFEGKGRKPHQKIKPYLVLRYLLERSDEEHPVSATDISFYLEEECGISANRQGIYRDIDEINRVLWMLENETNIDEADEIFDGEDAEEEKFIVYDSKQRGFYVQRRSFEKEDINIIADCIRSAKFVSDEKARDLMGIFDGVVSEYQVPSYFANAVLTDGRKAKSKYLYYNLSAIDEAMNGLPGEKKKEPEKIAFKYTKYTVNDMSGTTERRQGSTYVVSPFKLLINDGNYYLLGFSDKDQEMRTYRVDRMKSVKCLGEPVEGKEAFEALNMDSFLQRVFGMFSGETHLITLAFDSSLLDTMVERFGRIDTTYYKMSESEIKMSTRIDVSPQFFGWLAGFGNKVEVLAPEQVRDRYLHYLEEIVKKYR